MKFHVREKFLIAACAATLAFAGPIEDLQPGQWVEVPNSHLRSVAYQWPSGVTYTVNGLGIRAVMDTWSGGAFDTKRDRLIIWGGGHAAYAGNEIYAFDLNSLTWIRINDPSIPIAYNAAFASDGAPGARHTYNSIQYMPNLDRFCALGSGCDYPSGNSQGNHLAAFDFETLQWEVLANPVVGDFNCTAYDPVTGHAWSKGNIGQCYLAEYNPQNNTWTRRTDWQGCYTYYTTLEVDPKRRKLIGVGEGNLWSWDISRTGNLARTNLSTSGPQDIVNTSSPGFVYDPASDRLVGWRGGRDVYTLDLDTRTWTRVAGTGANPGAANSNGTYGRFRYSPAKNAFVVVNSVDANVFIFKLTGGTGVSGDAVRTGMNLSVEASPNPFRSTVSLRVRGVSGNQAWRIEIFDAAGRRAAQFAGAGTPDRPVEWKRRHGSGFYLAKLTSGGHKAIRPLFSIR